MMQSLVIRRPRTQLDELISLAQQLRNEYDITDEVATHLAQAMAAHKRSGRTGQKQLTATAVAQLLEA